MNSQFDVAWWGFFILGLVILFVLAGGLLPDAFGGPRRRRPDGVAFDSLSTPDPQDSSMATLQDAPVGDPQGFQDDTTPAGVWLDREPMTRRTADDLTVTVRPRWRVAVLVLFLMEAGFTVLLGWTIWEPMYERVAVFVVLGVVIAAIGFLQLRIRLEADLDGVVVANLFRRHTLHWSRVEAIGVETRTGQDAPTAGVLWIRVPEGDVTSQAARQAGRSVQQLQDLRVQLEELQLAASQPRDGSPVGRGHRVPTLSAWQGWAIGLGVALSALVGLAMLIGQAPRRDTGTVTTAGRVDAYSLVLGDCVADPALTGSEETAVSYVAVVPCSDRHDTEVFAVFDLKDGDYPGDDAVTTQADKGCYGAFADFVGLAYEDSELDYYFLTPTGDSWNQIDDREVACLVGVPGEQVTGTLQGSNR